MYENFSDEKLAEMANAGDQSAESALIERYMETARAKASLYYMLGADSEDVIQEGMVGLFQAIRHYSPERGASFRTFADLCINRRILTAVKGASRLKNSPLNNSVSFDFPIDTDSERTIGDLLPAGDASDPELRLINGDIKRLIINDEKGLFSALERSVIRGLAEGRDYRHIAEELGRTPKSIDNAIQRIRKKLSLFFEE
ncbi:MAG: sigma-70 family RNA polymerase sigma factor [Firmicutes bacterium]|nr:sigma-70 family RNA polymerase sigma factor [Bacillota bacterium]